MGRPSVVIFNLSVKATISRPKDLGRSQGTGSSNLTKKRGRWEEQRRASGEALGGCHGNLYPEVRLPDRHGLLQL